MDTIEKLAKAILILAPPALTYYFGDRFLGRMDVNIVGMFLSIMLGTVLVSATLGPLIFFLVKDRQRDKDSVVESMTKKKPGKYTIK